MLVSNYTIIATSPERRKILALAEKGIQSVTPAYSMPRIMSFQDGILKVRGKSFQLRNKRVFIVGAGKASAAMAVELERIIGIHTIVAGIVISNDTVSKTKKIVIHYADHPIPSREGFLGARKIFSLKNTFNIGAHDVFIVLVSGGASGMMPYPIPGVSLKDKKILTKVFLKSGIDNRKLGIVRKKISLVKGGGIAKHFYPAHVISLVLSDTVGSDFSLTAGGPCTKDKTTFTHAWNIVNDPHLRNFIPQSIFSYIKYRAGAKGECVDFSNVSQLCIADNTTALAAIKMYAEKAGVRATVKKHIHGEAKNLAYSICRQMSRKKIFRPHLFVYGGEMTVSLPKRHGIGGRNQEFIAACLSYFKKHSITGKWAIAAIATDGVDFLKESAGGIIDHASLYAARRKNLNADSFLERHDSHALLKRIRGNIYMRKPTGTYVNDIILCYIDPRM